MTCDGCARPCRSPAAWLWTYSCAAGHRTTRYRCQACHVREQGFRLLRKVPRCSPDCRQGAIMITAEPLEEGA
jgi:hypothetical protein